MNANYKSIISAISLVFALSLSISAAPGDLDPTFGKGGIVITNRRNVNGNGNNLYGAYAMAIQPEGKIVVVGEAFTNESDWWDFAVVRYNPDGSLDTSFGGGILNTAIGDSADVAHSVAIQTDGKIVVAGSTGNKAEAQYSFAVVRYNPDGSLDISFNGTGIVKTPVGNSGSGASSIAIQADGKIVVAGWSGNSNFAIVRYNADGSLDTSFNSSGEVITPLGYASSVAIQADGKIVVAGTSGGFLDSHFVIVRYNPDGSLDTSFNGTGNVITSVGNSGSGVSDLAIQTDGKIVVVGVSLAVAGNWKTAAFAIVRYNPDGSLDTSFNGTGIVSTPVGNSGSGASSVAIQANGKIVVAGGSNIGSDFTVEGSDFALVRLNPNGSLDTSFNGTSTVITSVGNAWDTASSVAIQADGRIVVAGDTGPDDFKDFAVVRYQGDDASPAACPNPIDCDAFFVRQQYLDFLGREPDSNGFANWMATLTACPNDGYGEFDNLYCDRVHVSAGFVQSNEFQGRGYWVLRFGYAGLNRSIGAVRSSATYAEFTTALAQVSGSNSPAQEEAAKVSYANAFVQRQDFLALFPTTMTAAQYVNALEANAQVTLSNKQALIEALNLGTLSRADVLTNVVESQIVFDKYIIPAFVTMEYFGYLHRDPDESGYQNWVDTLAANPSDYRHMVFGFIYSTEYRARFGSP